MITTSSIGDSPQKPQWIAAPKSQQARVTALPKAPEQVILDLPAEKATPSPAVLQEDSAAAAYTSSLKELAARVQEAVENLQERSTSVRFKVDKEASQIIIQVISQDSGEVIRQMPPEELLRAAGRLENLRGVLFDRKS